MSIDFNLFEKLREFITSTYNQTLNAKRLERLNKLFDDRTRIQALKESEKIKQILLNSSSAALSGAKDAKFNELECFLETSDADDFEMKYWTFSWNRAGLVLSRDELGKIIDIYSTLGKRAQIIGLNLLLLLLLAMSIWPFLLIAEKELFITLGFSESIWHIFILVISGFCLVTVIKILYDWSHWHDLNVILSRQKLQKNKCLIYM